MDEFSANIEKKFLLQFPELAAHCGEVANKYAVAFEVKIPSPASHTKRTLILETFNAEITVYFDSYHAHFSEIDGIDPFDNASAFLQKDLSNQYAVVSYWRDEQWCGSAMLAVTSLPLDNADYPYANSIKIRSWLGDYDKVLQCIARD